MDDVKDMCDHAAWLNHGELKAAGPAKPTIKAPTPTSYRTTSRPVPPASRSRCAPTTVPRYIGEQVRSILAQTVVAVGDRAVR